MKSRVLKRGHSVAIKIPRVLAKAARFQEGDWVDLVATEDGIEVRRATRMPKLAELVDRITQVNRHAEIVAGIAYRTESIDW